MQLGADNAHAGAVRQGNQLLLPANALLVAHLGKAVGDDDAAADAGICGFGQLGEQRLARHRP
jgi:hypothetical protein